MKPRCRWRIGENETLQPYSIKVYIVDNKRVDGKVKQETVAFLGSIDATWLDSFWAAPDPSVLDKIRASWWEQRSIRERIAFWQVADKRLKKLANRLGPDAKRLRMNVHAQIPWPKEAERDRLELLQAKSEAESWRSLYKLSVDRIERNEKTIEKYERENAESRKDAMRAIKSAGKWTEEVKRLKDKPRGRA